jgi:hypothetical protein
MKITLKQFNLRIINTEILLKVVFNTHNLNSFFFDRSLSMHLCESYLVYFHIITDINYYENNTKAV